MNKTRAYYCSIFQIMLRLAIAMALLVAAGVTIYVVISMSNPTFKYVWRMISALVVIGFPTFFISTVVYVLLFPVRLTEDGLIGHNSRGKKQYLAWAETVYTERLSNNGFPCLKLQSNSSDKYILIPTFLSHFDRFAEELKMKGIDLNGPPQPLAKPQTPAPVQRKRRRINMEQRREGAFIVISTERQPQ